MSYLQSGIGLSECHLTFAFLAEKFEVPIAVFSSSGKQSCIQHRTLWQLMSVECETNIQLVSWPTGLEMVQLTLSQELASEPLALGCCRQSVTFLLRRDLNWKYPNLFPVHILLLIWSKSECISPSDMFSYFLVSCNLWMCVDIDTTVGGTLVKEYFSGSLFALAVVQSVVYCKLFYTFLC